VRITFAPGQIYNLLGMTMDGVNVWILFKVALIMPASGVYAWFLTRLMQKHRLPDPDVKEGKDAVAAAVSGVPVAHKKDPKVAPAG
jgi:intracellular septation protein